MFLDLFNPALTLRVILNSPPLMPLAHVPMMRRWEGEDWDR